MRYRPEIDGLRSIAVLPVVLFHAGVPGFPGGFVGVDIFFVISGYLITGMIAEEIRQGSLTVVGFYERRIRRIFPALIVMLAACTVTALWLLFPDDLLAFARSVSPRRSLARTFCSGRSPAISTPPPPTSRCCTLGRSRSKSSSISSSRSSSGCCGAGTPATGWPGLPQSPSPPLH
jgi:hypothetical protein